jgi:DNA helicase-2/ATP-dependent DNA helicase PcrA
VEGPFAAAARTALTGFLDLLNDLIAGAPSRTVSQLLTLVIEKTRYRDYLTDAFPVDGEERWENVMELRNVAAQFDELEPEHALMRFLEDVALMSDADEYDEKIDAVTLITLHAAKGLEFPCVFLPGWEDGLFPSQRAMDELGVKGLEEERRLAHVGITRAQRFCTISFAANRRVYNQWQSQLPSRFIDELPPEHVEVLTPPGLYGGYGASTLADVAARADVYNSPGWKRMATRAAQRPTSQPQEARNMVIDTTAVAAFEPGARVFHQKFGYGTVTAVEGDKLAVEFDKAGPKNIVARFVTAADAVPF